MIGARSHNLSGCMLLVTCCKERSNNFCLQILLYFVLNWVIGVISVQKIVTMFLSFAGIGYGHILAVTAYFFHPRQMDQAGRGKFRTLTGTSRISDETQKNPKVSRAHILMKSPLSIRSIIVISSFSTTLHI